ncbi:Na+/H+ antiporter NhaA [Bifidobacterium sp. H6bp22N]|uniref:Na+/H+ antiporter NhaA n=1 Tax=Bifidobacterium polysaccharolyticum TaxID=2750967 RepID=UPI0028BE848A|nr:Na+/H+ antiporter NhaA [Bifidobacterium sp. H6bp22N]MDT7508477.1 Na+/H+ antiporter NhaA [Bifidobacterium sp. H6bp22N]
MPPTPTFPAFPVNPQRQVYDDSNSQQNPKLFNPRRSGLQPSDPQLNSGQSDSKPSNAQPSSPQRGQSGSDRDRHKRLHLSNFFTALSSLAENDRITGLFMMACALAGLILANLPETGPGLNALAAWIPLDLPGGLNLSLKDWIQDGLLTIFFLTMGLDLRQEAATGTLRDHRQVLLPLLSALGGVAVPILIYCLLNLGSPAGLRGWAVPTATDVAFSLAALQLLLPKAGPALQAFLMTLAIFDDLVGVLLIALGYSSLGQPSWLLVCLAGLVVWALLVRVTSRSARLWRPLVFLCLLGALAGGLLAWYSLFKAGIHPVLAGVAMGLLTPVARPNAAEAEATEAEEPSASTAPNVTEPTEHRPTDTKPSGTEPTETHPPVTSQANTKPAGFEPTEIEPNHNPTLSPAERLDHFLTPLSALVVLPLFAFFSLSISLDQLGPGLLTDRVFWGATLGLALGKPLGIMTMLILAGRLGLRRPAGSTTGNMIGLCQLCGIGFTMSFLIANLAFAGSPHLESALLGVLAGSVLSVLIVAVGTIPGRLQSARHVSS